MHNKHTIESMIKRTIESTIMRSEEIHAIFGLYNKKDDKKDDKEDNKKDNKNTLRKTGGKMYFRFLSTPSPNQNHPLLE